jgi:hypothetical protein
MTQLIIFSVLIRVPQPLGVATIVIADCGQVELFPQVDAELTTAIRKHPTQVLIRARVKQMNCILFSRNLANTNEDAG